MRLGICFLLVQLIGYTTCIAQITRGPYLQAGAKNEITIRWRTNTPENSKVIYGNTFNNYTLNKINNTLTTEHIVTLTGLLTNTIYYYNIGNTTSMPLTDNEKFFKTAPDENTTHKVSFVAFGDCGRNNAIYQDNTLLQYRNYLQANNINAVDAWLLLGDNAYSTGSELEYTNNFFNIYGNNILKNHKLYPAPGNHDYGNDPNQKPLRNNHYFTAFTLPKQAEAGGVASNRSNYYSYNIGNIHFLSLDSWGIEADNTHMGTNNMATEMKNWITTDLAANTSKWIVAYWHHPPYTKSSHNSDNEQELVNIRNNFIPFLESKGVDLVICGHSHAYERSYLLNGFTDSWNNFNPLLHAKNTSSAEYINSSSCPYTYNSNTTNHGTVYIVAGSTGASGNVQAGFKTQAMPYAVNDGGVFYVEVEDNRLDAKMIRMDGTIFDKFTILKNVNNIHNYNITVGNTQVLTASWPGNYSWNTGETTKTISFTPTITGVTQFDVKDDKGCLQDKFSVTATGVLPIYATICNIAYVNTAVHVNFNVNNTNNVQYFSIQKSTDGVLFEELTRFNNTTQLNFNYIDAALTSRKLYYKIMAVYTNNTTQMVCQKTIELPINYFEIVIRHLGQSSFNMQLNNYNLQWQYVTITNLKGQQIKQYNIRNNRYFNEAITLQKGVYIMQATHKERKITSRLIVHN